ncbi:cyclic AMP-dependent transcription factor ATF-4 [Pleurodeles waltl]|uniref:cyclic AMP-dependent transcription factor ATF-4 n=1 Tax=Pleurodeles waltl TaxID=8319 RepID=UPI003709BFAA
MDFSTNDILLGDFRSPFSQSSLAAEDTLGLLDDYLGADWPSPAPGFSILKSKDVLTDLLSKSLLHPTGRSEEDAFTGMDWMVEKMDLRVFEDFDSLLGAENMEATVFPGDLMAALEGSCDLLEVPHFPIVQGSLSVPEQSTCLAKSPLGADQVAPTAHFLFPINVLPEAMELPEDPFCSLIPTPKRENSPAHFPLCPSLDSQASSPDHAFSLELGSEVDIGELQKLEPSTKCEREEEISSDDSGICLSPELYLVSPKQSPSFSVEPPLSICMNPSYMELLQQSPASMEPGPGPELVISERPKPYTFPTDDKVLAKVKVAGGERKLDRKTKKMEQNKTAATRYRQKKRAEQEAISAECRELESKNDALQEKVDSLAKEIQYLKDLMEEVRTAKSKRAKSQSLE